jgi:Domain of unknown function (DUF3520)
MQSKLGLFVGIALAVAALSGCDDRDSGKDSTNGDKQKAATAPAPVRFGAGWHAVAETRQSNWSFASPPPPSRMLASQTNAPEALSADALAGIRAALMANMLPAHNSIRIEALVGRALSSIDPSAAETAPAKPMVVLTTTPWNDDSLLLWVEVSGLTGPDNEAPSNAPTSNTAIGIEFDPSAVAAFRTLGDPAALPSPAGGRVAMLYELLPQRTDSTDKSGAAKLIVKYAVLHVGGAGPGVKPDQPITTADAVGTIDNAPDIVRFATATAGFGGLLRGDPAMRDLSCNDVIALAQSIRQPDADGWRAQLIALMYRAEPLIDLPPAR